MSDLQIGLIVLGILLIVMVLAFNKWQNRRLRNKIQARFAARSEREIPPIQFSVKPGSGASPVHFVAGSGAGASSADLVAGSGVGASSADFVGGAGVGASSADFVAGAGVGASSADFVAGAGVGASSAHFAAGSVPDAPSTHFSTKIKPGASKGETYCAKSAPTSAQRHEPGLAAWAEHSTHADSGVAIAEIEDKDEVDPVCEVVIDVVFAQPVAGATLLSVTQNLRRIGGKPIRIFGQMHPQRHAATLNPHSQYTTLQIAVLLANRSGPLSAIEWSQIWVQAQDLAERFDGMVEGPDQQTVLAQAKQLDEVCAALDMQVVLKLCLQKGQSHTAVTTIVRDLGFVPDGQFWVWRAEDTGHTGLILACEGRGVEAVSDFVERLNLLLDVPCTAPDERAFSRMVEMGQQLARQLQAELVDEQGKPLAHHALAVIDQHLQALFHKLEQAGLRAGSERARRVFA